MPLSNEDSEYARSLINSISKNANEITQFDEANTWKIGCALGDVATALELLLSALKDPEPDSFAEKN